MTFLTITIKGLCRIFPSNQKLGSVGSNERFGGRQGETGSPDKNPYESLWAHRLVGGGGESIVESLIAPCEQKMKPTIETVVTGAPGAIAWTDGPLFPHLSFILHHFSLLAEESWLFEALPQVSDAPSRYATQQS